MRVEGSEFKVHVASEARMGGCAGRVPATHEFLYEKRIKLDYFWQ